MMNIVTRTWGSYEVLAQGKGWKLKRLMITPKSKSSFQKHFKRSELWFYPESKKCAFIFVEQWHQLINDSDVHLEIIELQFGQECIEEDIVRRNE